MSLRYSSQRVTYSYPSFGFISYIFEYIILLIISISVSIFCLMQIKHFLSKRNIPDEQKGDIWKMDNYPSQGKESMTGNQILDTLIIILGICVPIALCYFFGRNA